MSRTPTSLSANDSPDDAGRTGLTPHHGAGWTDLPTGVRINVVLLTALIAVLIAVLWPYWKQNPDLSHGFLMPLVFVLLLKESRAGYPRYLDDGAGSKTLLGTLLVLGVLALCATGLYAAAVAWTHPLVAFTLTAAIVFLLGAGLVSFTHNDVRLFPLNWASCSAVALWLLCAPIPPGSYTRLTLSLQLLVTETVLGALHLLGIAANRHGNIIDLAAASVGVEEACSGVRSLISCVFVGVFLSATLVRGPAKRGLVILLAAPIAIAMNFARSLALTLMANAGINISGRWHDLTGFAVLIATAIILAGTCLLLGKGFPNSPEPVRVAPRPTVDNGRTLRRPHFFVTATLVGSGALAAFFFLNTRPSHRLGAPVPDLAAILPSSFDTWTVETSTDLYQFSATLQTEHLAQRTYLRRTDLGVEQVTIYLAYWRAGQAPVSLVASHTPDACWPGSGWVLAPLPKTRDQLAVGARQLPDAEARKFQSGDYPQYVWFWHLYDGHPIAYRDPYSARELLNIAWRYGFTHEGDQLFVRVSSNRPWSALAREPLLAQVFARLQPLGL